MIELLGVTIGDPGALWFLLVGAATAILFVVRLVRRFKLMRVLSVKTNRASILKGFSGWSRIVGLVAAICAVNLICIGLADLRWGETKEKVKQNARDIFVALDISRSMLANDVGGRRLDIAKAKIEKLLKMLDSERVGLILFSGSALMQSPLTRDVAAFKMFLNDVDIDTISSGTTALSGALNKAVDSFSKFGGNGSKLLVVFTDGEDFSRDLSKAKERAAEAGVVVMTVGIGSEEGAPVPVLDSSRNVTGYQKDDKGNLVISRLNSGILENVAAETGGVYTRVTEDDSDMTKIVRRVIDFEKSELDEQDMTTHARKYHYFAGVAFLLLLAEWLLV